MFNVGGTLPAPVIYGLISELRSDRLAMRVLMYVPVVTVILFMFAIVLLIKNKTLEYQTLNQVMDSEFDQGIELN